MEDRQIKIQELQRVQEERRRTLEQNKRTAETLKKELAEDAARMVAVEQQKHVINDAFDKIEQEKNAPQQQPENVVNQTTSTHFFKQNPPQPKPINYFQDVVSPPNVPLPLDEEKSLPIIQRNPPQKKFWRRMPRWVRAGIATLGLGGAGIGLYELHQKNVNPEIAAEQKRVGDSTLNAITRYDAHPNTKKQIDTINQKIASLEKKKKADEARQTQEGNETTSQNASAESQTPRQKKIKTEAAYNNAPPTKTPRGGVQTENADDENEGDEGDDQPEEKVSKNKLYVNPANVLDTPIVEHKTVEKKQRKSRSLIMTPGEVAAQIADDRKALLHHTLPTRPPTINTAEETSEETDSTEETGGKRDAHFHEGKIKAKSKWNAVFEQDRVIQNFYGNRYDEHNGMQQLSMWKDLPLASTPATEVLSKGTNVTPEDKDFVQYISDLGNYYALPPFFGETFDYYFGRVMITAAPDIKAQRHADKHARKAEKKYQKQKARKMRRS